MTKSETAKLVRETGLSMFRGIVKNIGKLEICNEGLRVWFNVPHTHRTIWVHVQDTPPEDDLDYIRFRAVYSSNFSNIMVHDPKIDRWPVHGIGYGFYHFLTRGGKTDALGRWYEGYLWVEMARGKV